MTASSSDSSNFYHTVAQVGEKRIIHDLMLPLFNPTNSIYGVGDDCGVLEVPANHLLLTSTDRVPSDLIAFRLGIIDYRGLGRYLAVLNISDICASGGIPVALMLNLGLPPEMLLGNLQELLEGFKSMADEASCQVIGGDTTSSSELSISATSFGFCQPPNLLMRRNASVGDTIFISKPIGLTPTAFAVFLQRDVNFGLDKAEEEMLKDQFRLVSPMIELGKSLGSSLICTSCMDNTDGLAQSLFELADASSTAMIVDTNLIDIHPVVHSVAKRLGLDSIDFSFGPGADFSLVGTLAGHWSQARINQFIGPEVQAVGRVEAGSGVFKQDRDVRTSLNSPGWNYFSNSSSLTKLLPPT